MSEENKDINLPDDDIITWKVPEYTDNKKSKTWFSIAGATSAMLMIYSILTSNFAFAVFIVLAIIVIILRNKDEVNLVDIALTDDGVVVGKFYADVVVDKGIKLSPGDFYSIDIDNTGDVYVISTEDGEDISYTYCT